VLTQLDAGTHVDSPPVEVFKVSEVKIEPDRSDCGFFSIDGEVSPAENIWVKVCPSMASIVSSFPKDAQ